MTTIVDSKTVTSCICPDCGEQVIIEGSFAYYTKLEDTYCKLNLAEVQCSNCRNSFYASEYGLDRVPVEFLSESDREKNDFTGKMIKFFTYQDIKEGDNVVFTFSPTAKYKCNRDSGGRVVVEFPDGKNSHIFPKNLVYLSEE